MVHFADQQSAYEFDKRLALDSPSGMNDSGADSVWGLNILHQVAPAGVTTKDYNHREAQKVLQSARADITGGEGEEIRYGEVYHYKPRHLETGEAFSPAPETGNFWARLDHERFLAEQTLITGFQHGCGVASGTGADDNGQQCAVDAAGRAAAAGGGGPGGVAAAGRKAVR